MACAMRLALVSGLRADASHVTYNLRLYAGRALKCAHAVALAFNAASTSGGVTSGRSQNVSATRVSLVGPAAHPASVTNPWAVSRAKRRRFTFDQALPCRRGVNR